MKRLIITVISTLLAVSVLSTPANAAPTRKAGPVVAVGDSIVQGYALPSPDTQAWAARLGYIRTGSSGGCVISYCYGQDPMVKHFDAAVLVHRPRVVIIAYGINDLAVRQNSSEAIVDGLANLVWRARAAGAKAYVQTLAPVGPRVFDLNNDRLYVNALIRARFANVIDVESALINQNTGQLRWAYDVGDNIHPNAEGHRVMASVARAAVNG